MLDRFCTSFHFPETALTKSVATISPDLYRQLCRRRITEIPASMISSNPWGELARTLSSRFLPIAVTDQIWERSEVAFDKWVSNQLTPRIDAVHVYEHAGLACLARAQKLGIHGIYEQPSQHYAFFNRIVADQVARYPELDSDEAKIFTDSRTARRNSRRDKELALATTVLCNSSFTRRTLVEAGVDESKIVVVPLGYPPVAAKVEKPTDGPLIFLHAGTQNIRKGSHLLYRAWNACNFPDADAELWLVGKSMLPDHLRRNMKGRVKILDSIPHKEMLALYSSAHVLVLPTFADGFGMAITEAMSRGVPPITTANSCAGDLLINDQNGWLVDVGSVDSLVDRLRWCVNQREQALQAGMAARDSAAKWQWSDYRQTVAAKVANRLMQSASHPHS